MPIEGSLNALTVAVEKLTLAIITVGAPTQNTVQPSKEPSKEDKAKPATAQQKRKRRTKAEIAAEKKAEAAKASKESQEAPTTFADVHQVLAKVCKAAELGPTKAQQILKVVSGKEMLGDAKEESYLPLLRVATVLLDNPAMTIEEAAKAANVDTGEQENQEEAFNFLG